MSGPARSQYLVNVMPGGVPSWVEANEDVYVVPFDAGQSDKGVYVGVGALNVVDDAFVNVGLGVCLVCVAELVEFVSFLYNLSTRTSNVQPA